MGHTGCGAINAATEDVNPTWFNPMAEMVRRLKSNLTTTDKEKATIENVNKTIANIRIHSESLRRSEYLEHIQIRGGIYNIATGNVEFFDYVRPVEETT